MQVIAGNGAGLPPTDHIYLKQGAAPQGMPAGTSTRKQRGSGWGEAGGHFFSVTGRRAKLSRLNS